MPRPSSEAERLQHAECRWVGYELHDGLMQWLVGANLQLEAAVRSEQDASVEVQRDCVQSSMRMVAAAIEEGRELIAFLENPSTAQNCDVAVAVAGFVGKLRNHPQASSVTIEFLQSQVEWPQLPHSVAWSVLRVIQQAMLNALLHAQSTTIRAHLGWAGPGILEAEVVDDGRGFDVQSALKPGARPLHFGLSSMQHRAQMLHGQIEFDSTLDEGSRVRLTLPATTS
ncbi:sensor histidine kinase [Aureliella helgolandensis]|uniref:histidine kinase n=1 Tax=Aureliella helgolandensis TaxID=2527968 RepID=A0A518GG69_9BACT|nr:ATP-binding protein [Aureliella helgolandensis]QDV27596.1 Oxygen sensor histidine kinase NreB [Aureliella helgolandensis]